VNGVVFVIVVDGQRHLSQASTGGMRFSSRMCFIPGF
jgi:hypothetical protein